MTRTFEKSNKKNQIQISGQIFFQFYLKIFDLFKKQSN